MRFVRSFDKLQWHSRSCSFSSQHGFLTCRLCANERTDRAGATVLEYEEKGMYVRQNPRESIALFFED